MNKTCTNFTFCLLALPMIFSANYSIAMRMDEQTITVAVKDYFDDVNRDYEGATKSMSPLINMLNQMKSELAYTTNSAFEVITYLTLLAAFQRQGKFLDIPDETIEKLQTRLEKNDIPHMIDQQAKARASYRAKYSQQE